MSYVSSLCIRQLNEKGQYRLQSEDGGTAALDSHPSNVAGAISNSSSDSLTDLLSIGTAAVQSLQPDAAEAEEMAQLVNPLVLGESCHHVQLRRNDLTTARRSSQSRTAWSVCAAVV